MILANGSRNHSNVEGLLSTFYDEACAETSPTDNPYDTINILHAIRWRVDAWKTEAKTSTLEHCFEVSQVKIHGPYPYAIKSRALKLSLRTIYESIGVAHLGFTMTRPNLRVHFIDPAIEIIQDPISDIEEQILAFALVEVEEPADEVHIPSPITPQTALDSIESLLLFPLQTEATANTIQLQDDLKREKK